jgi:hypothetical protein
MSGGDGIRTLPETPDKMPVLRQASAKSGAVRPQDSPIGADLASVIDAWPDLPEPIRAGVLAMVRAASVKCDR